MAPAAEERFSTGGSTFPLAHHDVDVQGSPFAALISTGSLPAGTAAPASSSASTATTVQQPSASSSNAPPHGGPIRTAHFKSQTAHGGPQHTYPSEASYEAYTHSAPIATSSGPNTMNVIQGEMTATARAAVDSTSAPQIASSSSPTTGPAAHGSAFWAMTRQLQTRLQYARLKVDHGWQKQNLNEVENLYFRQLQRGQRKAREQQRSKATKKAQRQESVAPLSAKEARTEGTEKHDGGKVYTGTNHNDAGSSKVTVPGNTLAMDVDVEPSPTSAKDQLPPSATSNAPKDSDASLAERSAKGGDSASKPHQDSSAESTSASQPPLNRPTAGTPLPSTQKPGPALSAAAATASPPLTYDSFWSSVSSQRPNLAAITAQVAANSKGAGTPSSGSSSSGTGTGYTGYQNLQSFQALQAFRAALAGNASGETAELQGRTANSTASQNPKSNDSGQSDILNAPSVTNGPSHTQI